MPAIYVVDDNKVICKVLQNIIEDLNFNVIIESDAVEASKFLSSIDDPSLFSAIFMDLVMPEVSGFDLLKLVKSNQNIHQVPVILLTAKDDSSNMFEGYNLGADYYMTKPVNKKQVAYALESVLNLVPSATASAETF